MRWRIPDDVVYRDLAGEAVLLDLASGTYFGLDPVGTRIWHLLGEGASTDRMVETLLAEYDVEEPRLRRDVEELVAQLADKGLVRDGDPGDPDDAARTGAPPAR